MTDSKLNHEVYKTPAGGTVRSWTKGVAFEDEAKVQVENIANMLFFYKWVAIMPDVHKGIGALSAVSFRQ